MNRSDMVGIETTGPDCTGYKESAVDPKAEYGRFPEKMAAFGPLGGSGQSLLSPCT